MLNSEFLKDSCPLCRHEAYNHVIEAYICLGKDDGHHWGRYIIEDWCGGGSKNGANDIEEDPGELKWKFLFVAGFFILMYAACRTFSRSSCLHASRCSKVSSVTLQHGQTSVARLHLYQL